MAGPAKQGFVTGQGLHFGLASVAAEDILQNDWVNGDGDV
jgi:hypothetical protein